LLTIRNNFDLVRLAAALQVAIHHSLGHLQVAQVDWPILRLTSLFPGVPIFFFVSGFLISKSFERNPVLHEYALNRALRIYPALFVCLFVSLALVWIAGYFDVTGVQWSQVLPWALGQISFVQFYNPDFLRGYGTGVLNGSLWTIAVELQFYFLVPVLYGGLRLRHVSRRASNWLLIGLVLLFLSVNQVSFAVSERHAELFWYKLLSVSFAPWFYMFLVGMLFQRNFDICYAWLKGRFVIAAVSYCAVAFAASTLLDWRLGNALHPALFLALCLVVFTAAFSFPDLSDKLLGRNDLSYGVYIYHMPIVNFLLFLGMGGTITSFVSALIATLLMAYLSWVFVERPTLGVKRHPLYQHDAARIIRKRSQSPG
jgi:peptidoglycan/LPS O-acetylase OafA/YrhL